MIPVLRVFRSFLEMEGKSPTSNLKLYKYWGTRHWLSPANKKLVNISHSHLVLVSTLNHLLHVLVGRSNGIEKIDIKESKLVNYIFESFNILIIKVDATSYMYFI